jgi:hypothetical protein
MVMPAARIADLYRQVATVAPHGADARALYLPGVNVVAIPYYSRTTLGHELAHYLTDHYLKSTPRQSWERIALMVEDALPGTPRIVARRSSESHALAADGPGAARDSGQVAGRSRRDQVLLIDGVSRARLVKAVAPGGYWSREH